jgi:hypothetical protein
MCLCHRFTSIATLIIGLQLFNPMFIGVSQDFSLSNKAASDASLIASPSQVPSTLAHTKPSNDTFNPPDNQGPDSTRGSGTR